MTKVNWQSRTVLSVSTVVFVLLFSVILAGPSFAKMDRVVQGSTDGEPHDWDAIGFLGKPTDWTSPRLQTDGNPNDWGSPQFGTNGDPHDWSSLRLRTDGNPDDWGAPQFGTYGHESPQDWNATRGSFRASIFFLIRTLRAIGMWR